MKSLSVKCVEDKTILVLLIMSNQTVNNLKVLGKIFYDNQSFVDRDIAKIIPNIIQFSRNDNTNETSLLNDDFIINKNLDVKNNLKTKNARLLSVIYEDDLDELAQPRSQAKAFTNQNRTDIQYAKDKVNEIIPTIIDPVNKILTIKEIKNNDSIILDGDIISKKRIYQEIDPNFPYLNGAYSLAKDAFPAIDVNSTSIRAVTNWNFRTCPFVSWLSVCWSPQLRMFVAVGETPNSDPNRAMYSYDGINWTSVSVEVCNWVSVCWSPDLNLFIAIAAAGTGSFCMKSSNGISWTPVSVAPSTWVSVVWSPELKIFCAVATTGTNKCMISSDGDTWTLGLTNNNNWRSISWSPELKVFVAVANGGNAERFMTSSDGLNWTTYDYAIENEGGGSVSSLTHNFFSICWSSELGIFVGVSSTGVDGRVSTSRDGVNWKLQSSPLETWRSVIWVPELNLFLVFAISSANGLMTSPDGVNWTLRNFSTEAWRGSCWSPELGIVVVVGATGANRVATSSLKTRPPRCETVFDYSTNNIDSNGNWNITFDKSIFKDGVTPQTYSIEMVNSNSQLEFKTNLNLGKYNFYSNVAGADSSLIEFNDTQINCNRNFVLAPGRNLTQTGTSFINQETNSSNYNSLKRTWIVTNLGDNAQESLSIHDSNGRGFIFAPRVTSSAYHPLSSIGDAVIANRYRPPGEGVGIVIALQNSNNTGIKLSSPAVNTGSITLRQGSTTIVIDEGATNPISINNKIKLVGSTAASRQLEGISTLNLTDTLGGSQYFNMMLVGNETRYINYLNGQVHSFWTHNGSVHQTKLLIEHNQSQLNTPLYINNTTTNSIQNQISTSTDGIADYFSTSSGALNSSHRFRVRNSSGASYTALEMKAQTGSTIPLSTFYGIIDSSLMENQGTLAEMGRVTRVSKGSYSNITSGYGTVQSILTNSISFRGTYMNNYSIYIKNPDGAATATITDLLIGVGTSSSVIDIEETQIRKNNIILTPGQEIIEQLPSTVRISPINGLALYLNIRIEYTTSGAALQRAIAYSIARII